MERAKKDTRVVRVKRGKAGLGFSLKGGSEHGIPILVCDVEKKGATGASALHARSICPPPYTHTWDTKIYRDNKHASISRSC